MADEDVSLIVSEIEKSLEPRQNDARKVSEFLRSYLKGDAPGTQAPAPAPGAPAGVPKPSRLK